MTNYYRIGDAIEFCQMLKGVGVKGVATSPPYNRGLKGRVYENPKSNWKGSKLMAEGYSHLDDDMPEDKYIKWQRDFLSAALECVDDDGVILYNQGRRIKNHLEDRREEIVRGFPVRQTIIWNRGSSHNQGGKRPTFLPPIYELIYVIAKKGWRLPESRLKEFRHWGDVWRIPFETGNPHPAPFPLRLAIRMAKLIDGFLIDPFAGSGTMGIAADELGLLYALNDLSPEYKEMFKTRLKNHKPILPSLGLYD